MQRLGNFPISKNFIKRKRGYEQGQDVNRKTFAKVETLDDLNKVNDAQKVGFNELVAADPDLDRRRIEAYTGRWKEALVYVRPGCRLLDIGAGWPIGPVCELLQDYRIDYHPLDIEAELIDAWRARLPQWELPSSNANVSPNTALPYADSFFDFVFSSHCVEHSTDLALTFAEIRRVLKPHGTLFFAVPFGFDVSDEHILFLDVEDWLSATELAGFEVINTHIGKTYPMSDWDLAIVARRKDDESDFSTLNDIARRRSKVGLTLAYHGDPIFDYSPPPSRRSGLNFLVRSPSTSQPQAQADFRSDRVIYSGRGRCYSVDASELRALLFFCHSWSGIIRIEGEHGDKIVDLYSRYPHIAAVGVEELQGILTVSLIGKNDLAKAEQAVTWGALL